MNHALLRREIVIQAPAERIWQFISTEEGLRQWWGEGVSIEPKEGGRCTEKSQVQGEVRHLTGVITVYDPPRRLTLTLRPEHNPGHWPELTVVSITLQQEAEQTRVTLVHQAFAAEPLTDVAGVILSPTSSVSSGPQLTLGRGKSRLPQRKVGIAPSGKRRTLPASAQGFSEDLSDQFALAPASVRNQTLWVQRLTALRDVALT